MLKDILNPAQAVKKLPDLPGVYIMKDKDDEIIYIGKAKNLKNRVSSYFKFDAGHTDKVRKMVSNVHHFDYIVTDSEFEALVLECSLIKKHQPKYNILLKDDKGFNYIKITNDNWPKILSVKQKSDDNAVYIGPYTNSLTVKQTVSAALNIFKLPTCSRNLDKFFKRPCLNYYIKKCSAPCIRAISHDDYLKSVENAIDFIKNGSTQTEKMLKEKMQKASDELDFEYAAKLRDTLKSINNIKLHQKVVAFKNGTQDVIAVSHDDKFAAFEVFEFLNGDLCASKEFVIEIDTDIVKTRTEFIKSYYQTKNYVPKNIVLDGEIESESLIKEYLQSIAGHAVNLVYPQKGEQFKLVQMCLANAEEALLKSKAYKSRQEDTLEELKNMLGLKNLPNYIEAYDISNIRGSDNVGAMIVFKSAKPLKSAYKKFKINISGQDDYGSMRQMLTRRFEEYTLHKESSGFGALPDLILVDGGQTHVAAVKDVLKSFDIKVPVFGMVKDSKHRTRAITTSGAEIDIKPKSRVFAFVTRVQDEVHRFTINYHKHLRNKRMSGSILTDIEGIGDKKAKQLLKKFKSVDVIANTSVEDLQLVDGINRKNAENIYVFFHQNQ